jgi:putative CRISPR-associated protein (TIGR02620 family)
MEQAHQEKSLTRTIAVTRHPGAAEWMRSQYPNAEFVDHIEPAELLPGDRVIGTLRVNLAAAIVARGASFDPAEIGLSRMPMARNRRLTTGP